MRPPRTRTTCDPTRATARGKQVHAGACDGQSACMTQVRQTPTPGPGPDDARTCATSPRGVPPGLRACAPCCAARVLLPGARAARVCCACTAAHAPTPALPTRVWSRACGARAVLCRRGAGCALSSAACCARADSLPLKPNPRRAGACSRSRSACIRWRRGTSSRRRSGRPLRRRQQRQVIGG
jgi:hypothetical protein